MLLFNVTKLLLTLRIERALVPAGSSVGKDVSLYRYSLIRADGAVLAESNSAKKLETLRADMLIIGVESEVFVNSRWPSSASVDCETDAPSRSQREMWTRDHIRDYQKHYDNEG